MARYDSWNPVERMTEASRVNCMVRAAAYMDIGLRLLPGQSLATSLRQMNRKALITDAPQPVTIT